MQIVVFLPRFSLQLSLLTNLKPVIPSASPIVASSSRLSISSPSRLLHLSPDFSISPTSQSHRLLNLAIPSSGFTIFPLQWRFDLISPTFPTDRRSPRQSTMPNSPTRIMGDSHSDNSLQSGDENLIVDGVDSDISLQSGDPDKYWWIGGDDPYWFPHEWVGAEGQPNAVHNDDAPTMDEVSSEVNPRILELEDLTREMEGHTRYLEGRIQMLQADAQVREAELTRMSTVNQQLLKRDEVREEELTRASSFNNELAERVAGFCTYIYTKWASDAAGDARFKWLTHTLQVCIAIIFALLAVVVALLTM